MNQMNHGKKTLTVTELGKMLHELLILYFLLCIFVYDLMLHQQVHHPVNLQFGIIPAAATGNESN